MKVLPKGIFSCTGSIAEVFCTICCCHVTGKCGEHFQINIAHAVADKAHKNHISGLFAAHGRGIFRYADNDKKVVQLVEPDMGRGNTGKNCSGNFFLLKHLLDQCRNIQRKFCVCREFFQHVGINRRPGFAGDIFKD